MRTVLVILAIWPLLLTGSVLKGQARLDIVNDSRRQMTAKIMHITPAGDKLNMTEYIGPFQTTRVYFTDTGHYYVKSKAVTQGTKPIYMKDDPFHVYNGRDGYSVLTLTYTIKESEIPQSSGGEPITEAEFEKNN